MKHKIILFLALCLGGGAVQAQNITPAYTIMGKDSAQRKISGGYA